MSRALDAKVAKASAPPEEAPAIKLGPLDLDPRRMRIVCPAGSKIAGTHSAKTGCVCGVAREFVDLRRNPRSLVTFCMNEYRLCPTWRAARDADDEARSKALDRELRADERRARQPREERE